jgi:hypothetical protein
MLGQIDRDRSEDDDVICLECREDFLRADRYDRSKRED